MSRIKSLTLGDVSTLGIYEAATMDGYWEDKALEDLQIVFLKGQLEAIQSIHRTMGDKRTLRRIHILKGAIKELEQLL